jgi:hypothetical protein
VAAGSDHPLLGSRRPIKNVVPPATRLSSPTSATKSAQSGHHNRAAECPLSGGGFNGSTQHLLILLEEEVCDGGDCTDMVHAAAEG